MASVLEKIQRFASRAGASCASAAKMLIMSRRPFSPAAISPSRPLVILGNGPSLAETVQKHPAFLRDKDLLAVNFAANTPLFAELKPQLYMIADPGFFTLRGYDKIPLFWDNLNKADWDITLFVPAKFLKGCRAKISNPHIRVMPFNMTPAGGFRPLRHFAYRTGLAMPRPRNVLIPALMTAIRAGYREIYIAGADHSWSKTLWVDDRNRVVTVQPHFYPDDEKEQERVAEAYKGIHLHDIFTSFAVAFSGYFEIEDYARSLGVRILNVTPGSFIDAFERMKI